jgi:murein DD-endopeptidase MepM/ murein hydrolase activator NlpD
MGASVLHIAPILLSCFFVLAGDTKTRYAAGIFTRMLEAMRADTMALMRTGVLLLGALCAAATAAQTRAGEVILTPAIVVAGSPELIRVEAPAATQVDGEWLGKKIEFFRSKDGRAWLALAGVDVEAAAGSSTLHINVKNAGGEIRDLSEPVVVRGARYRTETLNVAPKFVEPGPDELKRIEGEVALKEKVFGTSLAEPEWSGDFRAPVAAQPTDSFGVRRTFNGKLASVHKGMDFRAAMGTPVHAANSGVVVLARPLYYEGNCVVIDHGLGFFTLSMHLSRIDVHEGDRVAQGQRLGLSGATGRVTGPHLHWAVRWQGAYLDPAKVLKMDLATVN